MSDDAKAERNLTAPIQRCESADTGALLFYVEDAYHHMVALQNRVAELEAQLQAWRDLCVRKKFDTCGRCGWSKKPFGRDAPPSSNYCSHGCGGYLRDPYPSQLWPGECYDSRGMPAQPPQQETP